MYRTVSRIDKARYFNTADTAWKVYRKDLLTDEIDTMIINTVISIQGTERWQMLVTSVLVPFSKTQSVS